MTQRAALYARVSTLQQEQEATIESQVAALEAFGRQHGFHLSPDLYFLDQGVSGAQMDRPALNRLRDLAPEGAFDAVLCLSPDRLARQYVYQWVLLDELRRVGVEMLFVNQPTVANGPQGQLMLGVQGLFAEYERALITERLRRGKLYRMRQGQLVNPNPPYGYQYVPMSEPHGGRWVPDPVEAEIVRHIYLWYTDDGLTITAIVDRLNQPETQARPRGKRWTYSTVQTVLKQPAYTGRAYYNRTRTCHEAVGRPKKSGRGTLRRPSHEPRSREEWIEIPVPALMDEALWQRAQERLAAGSAVGPWLDAAVVTASRCTITAPTRASIVTPMWNLTPARSPDGLWSPWCGMPCATCCAIQPSLPMLGRPRTMRQPPIPMKPTGSKHASEPWNGSGPVCWMLFKTGCSTRTNWHAAKRGWMRSGRCCSTAFNT
jgi:DNA invertase Pin-like site-specific DNA recombinase